MASPPTPAADLVSSYVAIWNGADDAALDTLLTADFHRLGDGLSESADGIPALRALLRKMRLDMPDLQVVVVDSFATDDRIAIHWRLSGTDSGPGDYPPTNRQADVFGISLLRVRDGRLAEEVIAVDGLSLLTQLGFTITPPATTPSS